ncbi:MAG: hypothetical protein ACI97A_002653 [Planctomycetota bacterium]|jgi:hypothetical protein
MMKRRQVILNSPIWRNDPNENFVEAILTASCATPSLSHAT